MGIAVRNMRKYKKQGYNLMINNTAEILKRIRAELDNIESGVKPIEPSEYPDNLMGGVVIHSNGQIQEVIFTDIRLVRKTFDQGNWFATKEEAELEVKRRAVIQKMRAYHLKGGNYGVYYNVTTREFGAELCVCTPLFEIYIRSPENAQACIDALGSEILEVL